jgi:NAD(P)-dependent dehydrogenase (short-subunit alcohol dehydrogenase family)
MLEGQTAVVTGAGRGIGRAIAVRLAAAGANVVVNYYLNREAAEQAAAEIRSCGVRAHVVQADMKDPDQIRRLFDEVGTRFGGLDILVSNAASGVFRPAGELTPKHWDWMMHTHPRAFLLCAQAAVPLMQGRRGRMVAVSSLGSQRTIPNYAGMGAAKGALESLTRYLAVEYGPRRGNRLLAGTGRDGDGARRDRPPHARGPDRRAHGHRRGGAVSMQSTGRDDPRPGPGRGRGLFPHALSRAVTKSKNGRVVS